MLYGDNGVGLQLTLNMSHLKNLHNRFSKEGFTYASIQVILAESGIDLDQFYTNMVY